MTGFAKAVACAVAALGVAGQLNAQLANPSTAALGMGENFTAVARGYSAVSWNPAALGLRGNPHTSAMIGGLQVQGGMGPVALSDLTSFADQVVPEAVKQRWLADIRRDGGQLARAGFDMTWATLQTGLFALQVSSTARSANDISPDFAELMLFGNVDDEGNAKSLDLSGSAINVQVHSSIALSFGVPIALAGGASRLALGVTGKHTIGHVLAVSEPSLGATTNDPLSVNLSFPIAYTPVVKDNQGHQLKSGSGFGLDVAAAYETNRVTVAAVAHNVFNSFEWNPQLLRYRPAELVFADTASGSRFAREPLTAAPEALRARVASLKFNPAYSVGAMVRPAVGVTLAADARVGSTDGMSARAPVHAGAGAELRPLTWLPIQLGAAYIRTGPAAAGMQLTGGLGLKLGGFMMSVSGARRSIGGERENVVMVGLISHSFLGIVRPAPRRPAEQDQPSAAAAALAGTARDAR